MPQVSLHVQEVGPGTEGVEQAWKCSDQKGEVFSFSTFQTSDKNALALKPGTVLLVAGPPAQTRTRREVSEAFERVEQALNSLGVERKSQA